MYYKLLHTAENKSCDIVSFTHRNCAAIMSPHGIDTSERVQTR